MSACAPGTGPAEISAEQADLGAGDAAAGEQSHAAETDTHGDTVIHEDTVAAELKPVAFDLPPLADELRLPPGIVGVRWAEGLVQPAAIAVDTKGQLLVAERVGRVWALHDGDGDGLADDARLFVEGLGDLRGMAVGANGDVYLSEGNRVIRARDDGVADSVTTILRGLPLGLHAVGGIAEGPDGRIYLGLGSTCNDCSQRDPLSASVLVFDAETAQIAISASGLRNPMGLVFSPDGQLWATDHGSQRPCASPDELNLITPGAHYGWPYCHR
jgi:glucose/arabinose dehydrogenase